MWQEDAERDESTRRLVAAGANQDLLNFRESSESTRRFVALMASESVDGNDAVWPHYFHISIAYARKLIKEHKEIQGLSVINWQQQTWQRTIFLTRQFSYQMQKPTYSPTQYCVWEGPVKIPSKFGRRRSIRFRIQFNIENWIESMVSRWMEFEWKNFPGFIAL